MPQTALVIGGTGPTGPCVIEGLRQRGYRVSILHRGVHEVELPAEVEHIHADPHFTANLTEALAGRTFDLTVSMYGRLRHTAQVMRGRTERFIGVGGVAVYLGWVDLSHHPGDALPLPIPEDALLVTDPTQHKFTYLMVKSEEEVMEGHRQGAYNGTVLRYPIIYGPRQLVPREWSIIRRVLDGRKHFILPEGGLYLETRGYADNMAHALLLCVDQPDRAGGQIYNVGDDRMCSLREWVEMVCAILGHRFEMVTIPLEAAFPARVYTAVLWEGQPYHRVMDISKIKRELGYRDPVPVEEALRRTVRWHVDHRYEPGGEIEKLLGDPFDYEAEDRLIRAYRDSVKHLSRLPGTRPEWSHPYPHPKEPHQGS
ncbi:MAG: NAD-dependent epimerase/dehydratase family protein [Dehalococcoidia bacterium]|nr:NAD-dependent epimerase/dehydratase family protein [Dehalococcoidia bacterium]